MSPLQRLLAYARSWHGRVRRASLYSILNKLFDIAPEVLIGIAVDLVVQRQDSVIAQLGFNSPTSQLFVLALLTLLIWMFESVFQYLYSISWRGLAQDLQHKLRLDAYAHIQTLDMAWFEKRSSGGVLTILNDDVNQLERFLDTGANEILQVTTSTIAVGAIFFYLAPSVAIFSFLPVPLILVVAMFFRKRLGPRYAIVREAASTLGARLANNLGGMATIKAFTAEQREVEALTKDSAAYQEANQTAIKLSSAFVPVIRMTVLVGFVITLVYGGYLTLAGDLAVGAYSVLVFLTQRLLWPFTRLGETLDLFERAMASASRVLDILETPNPILEKKDARRPEVSSGLVEFSKVCFAYNTREPLFDNLSLKIPAGHMVAFVGATGSGKSTLIKLLLRFYEAQEGEIRIDGVPIQNWPLRDLRQHIALVSQDVFLFEGSVADNIAYGKPNARREEIEMAAKMAEADTFIQALPQGYDTPVGERGQQLSGGQRQRLCIARAILKDAPIMVFDEATSAVDNETELAIQLSLDKLARGRTLLVIAHRLSTIRHADTIYVLDHGRISGSGDHATLVRENEIYRRLWQIQTGETAGTKN